MVISPLDFFEVNQVHQICSIQQPEKVGIVPLAIYLKPGRIIWQWAIWEGRWRLDLASVAIILETEIRYTFFPHVKDTYRFQFGTKEPLVTPFAVAVIVDNVNWPPQRDCATPTDVFIEKSVCVSLVDHGCF